MTKLLEVKGEENAKITKDKIVADYSDNFWEIISESAARMWVVINFDFIKENFSKEIVNLGIASLRNYRELTVLNYIQEALGMKDALFVKSVNAKTYFSASSHDVKILQDRFFYPTLKIKKNKYLKKQNVEYKEVDLYIPESFKRDAILGFDTKSSHFMAHNVNYFTKYLWHTYCHNQLQDITDQNFKLFKGEAREDSDFLADSLANYMLILSYGVPMVGCNHLNIKGDDQERLKNLTKKIFKANRCNTIFLERESERPGSNLNNDNVFRYKRNLTNYLCGYILVEGFALEEVKIFLAPESYEVILRVNGKYIYTNFYPAFKGDNIEPRSSVNKPVFRQIASFVSMKLVQKLNKIIKDDQSGDYMKQIKADIESIILKTTKSKHFVKAITSKPNLIYKDFPVLDDDIDEDSSKKVA